MAHKHLFDHWHRPIAALPHTVNVGICGGSCVKQTVWNRPPPRSRHLGGKIREERQTPTWRLLMRRQKAIIEFAFPPGFYFMYGPVDIQFGNCSCELLTCRQLKWRVFSLNTDEIQFLRTGHSQHRWWTAHPSKPWIEALDPAGKGWDRAETISNPAIRSICDPHMCWSHSVSGEVGPAPPGPRNRAASSKAAWREGGVLSGRSSQCSHPAPSRSDWACCSAKQTTHIRCVSPLVMKCGQGWTHWQNHLRVTRHIISLLCVKWDIGCSFLCVKKLHLSSN